MKCKRRNAGFTLTELIVVIAIITFLTSILSPQFTRYVNKSRTVACQANLTNAARAYIYERALNPDGEATDLMNEIMEGMGATRVPDAKEGALRYSNLCPAGGDVTLYFVTQKKSEDKLLQILCTEHKSNTTFRIPDVVISTIFAKWDGKDEDEDESLIRRPEYEKEGNQYKKDDDGNFIQKTKNGVKQWQTLKEYLNADGRVIDSNASKTIPSGDVSFTYLVNRELESTLPDQSWKIVTSKNSDQSLNIDFYVTTDGAITEDDNRQTVNVIKYRYNDKGEFETDSKAKASVSYKDGYYILNPIP